MTENKRRSGQTDGRQLQGEEPRKRSTSRLQRLLGCVYLLHTAALLAVPKKAERQLGHSCLLAEGIQEHRVTAAGQETAQDAECRKEVGSTIQDAFQDLGVGEREASIWYNYREKKKSHKY